MKDPPKPRILFFIPILSIGGAERHTVDLCWRLRQRGYWSRILVHGRERSPIITAMPSVADAVFLDLKGMSDLMGWLAIWRILRQLKPDIVVCINQTPLIITVIERFLFATRAKIACVFHTTDMPDYERYQWGLFRLAAPFTDLLIYVGENQRRVWEKRGIRPRRTSLIRNGIDTGLFKPGPLSRAELRAPLGLDVEDYVVGIVASFRVQKNHVELVRAVARARDEGVVAKILCVGEGITRTEVSDLAASLGIADALVFAGEQSDVTPFIAACDVGVLCSTSETFPLSAIEFLAMGVPMISADVGGAGEIVQNGVNGLLYRSGDVDDFARAIATLADGPRRAAFAARAEHSVAAFSVDTMADTYAKVLDDLARS